MSIRPEVLPFIGVSLLIAALIALVCRRRRLSWRCSAAVGGSFAMIAILYMVYFFRDPERVPPPDPALIVAAADGVVASITELEEDKHLHTRAVRISIYLGLMDVHVNRAPIAGKSTFLGYVPGKHLFTLQEKSSEVNQHNSILMEGEKTRCLVRQIVGPICRRVVYWPDKDQAVDLEKGERIGMMKFGSRLDMYFPKDDIEVVVNVGDRVTAGETTVARLCEKNDS